MRLCHSVLIIALVAVGAAHAASVTRTVYAMGTRLTLTVEGAVDEVALQESTERALRECERIEAEGSTWRDDSRFSRLNQAEGRRVHLGQEWVGVLARVLEWTKQTGGAFDPVLAPLVDAWGLRMGGREPTAEQLAGARAASGAANLELDTHDGSARLKDPRAGIEESGFLKGYALDRMAAVLHESGVTDAVLDFGGQLFVLGRPRQLGVAGPTARGDEAYSLTLRDGSLSTSGTSEHGRHILDPHSGQRCPAWGSVSVVADTGLDADVLSTALFVMGPIEGRAFAESHHLAALFQPTGAAAFWTTAFAAHAPLATPRPTEKK